MCLLVLFFGFSACKGKSEKKAELKITQTDYSIVKDGKFSYSLNVTGKIRNIGAVDVKNVVVTGYCRSCKEPMISNTWYATQVVKRPEQKAVIAHLPSGTEEAFSFDDIAYYYTQTSEEPKNLPDNLELVIESYEIAE